jgi:hypothetical protein
MTWAGARAPVSHGALAVQVLETALQPFSRFRTPVSHCAMPLLNLKLA